MKLLTLIYLILNSDYVFGQTVRRANLLQYRAYMIDVVSETLKGVEEREWCNLKIPDISEDVQYKFFGHQLSGHVSYKNGYVVSIQHVDIVQSTVQQVWTWNTANREGRVDLRAQLRLHDVVLGFDVEAQMDGKKLRYTSTFRHRLLSFNFSILKNMRTNNITVTITGVNPRSNSRMSYVPNDEYSDVLGTSFTQDSTLPGILSWGTDIFQPIAYKVVTTQVVFPPVCYNC